MEVVNLGLFDLDLDRGTLMVRQGKGKRDRMVPVGDRASAWIEKYRADVRPELVVEPDEGGLFLTADGERFSPNGMTALVRGYVVAADLGKRGACHLFRHPMATLMLEGGADPLHPADARPREAGDHADLHPGLDPAAEGDPHGDAPQREARGQARSRDRPGGARRRGPACRRCAPAPGKLGGQPPRPALRNAQLDKRL